jgi:lysophospholipase L1-like esterase
MQGTGDSQGEFFARLEQSGVLVGTKFINAGKGGNTTRDMLARAGGLAAYRPYDLVVMLGCNDLPRDNDGENPRRVRLAEYSRNLAAILRAIRGERSLFISSFLMSPAKGMRPETFEQYMTVAISLAKENGYEVWDFYRESLGYISTHWATDGVHMKDSGHELVAAELAKRLK